MCPDANQFQTAGQEKQSHQLHNSWLTGRGLAIHTQLSSPCPELVSEARLFHYHLHAANNFWAMSYLMTNFLCGFSQTVSGDLTIWCFSPRTQRVHDTPELNGACVQEMIDRQLPDGGWPFRAGTAQSAVEPTALALLALPSNSVRERDAAIHFLLHVQNANGSWPAFSGDEEGGSGLTGMALYALNRCSAEGMVTDRAVQWLIESRGWESHWLWKWKFRTSDRYVRFDPDKFGWPWIPETVSWVVPTAYSILALKHSRGISHQGPVQLRIRRGVEMLYDRVCPAGGWNAGNGVVYGIPLAPHADVTALALLSLLNEPPNHFITSSLDWLERRAETCFAPWSLAWTILALDAFGRPTALLTDRLFSVVDNAMVHDGATLAAVLLALRSAKEDNAFQVAHET